MNGSGKPKITAGLVRPEDLSEAFAAFRENGQKAGSAMITEAIARTLPYRVAGAEFFGLIGGRSRS